MILDFGRLRQFHPDTLDFAAGRFEVRFQGADARSKSVAESRFRFDPREEGAGRYLRPPPSCSIGHTGADARLREGVRQPAAAARCESHRRHVVGWRDVVGTALLRDERQIAAVHVRVPDQGAEGPEEFCAGSRFEADLTAGGEAARNDGPVGGSGAHKFRIQCGQGNQPASPQAADAVKSLDLEESLASWLTICDLAAGTPVSRRVCSARCSASSRSRQRSLTGLASASLNLTIIWRGPSAVMAQAVNLGCSPPADDPGISPRAASSASRAYSPAFCSSSIGSGTGAASK